MKKQQFFPVQETPTPTIRFFENRDLKWYSRSGEMILGVCLLYPVFPSDVLSDVIGVINKYSADSALSNSQSNFA